MDTSLIDSFPFSSHLNSNYIPTDEEIMQIKAFLAEASKQLEEMKADMDRLDPKSDNIKKKHVSLYFQFKSCAALITLPRRLPDDILREIFYESLPTDRNPSLSKNAAPLVFTRVTNQWRQVAFSTPRLWSRIHIHVVPMLSPFINSTASSEELVPHQRDEMRAAAASQWLKRSGNLPLHVSVFGDKKYPPSLAFFDLDLKSIVPFAPRWKSLVLRAPCTSLSGILNLQAVDLESLQSLSLDFDPDGDGNGSPSSEQVLSSFPKCGLLSVPSLRKISIRQIVMNPSNFGVNWPRITHLELGAPSGRWHSSSTLSMAMASKILQASTHLIDCRLEFSSWARGFHGHPIAMRLLHLRRLSIQMQTDILRFTEKLDIPGLQKLELQIIGNEINRSTCLAPLFHHGAIRTLVIDSLYLDHASFLEVLRKCPELTSLTVSQDSRLEIRQPGSYPEDRNPFRIDDAVLECISTHSGDILSPHLEEFICKYVADFSAAGLIACIKRKQDGSIPGIAKLKKVEILSCSKGEQLEDCALFEELRPYITDGLSFQIFPIDTAGATDPVNDELIMNRWQCTDTIPRIMRLGVNGDG